MDLLPVFRLNFPISSFHQRTYKIPVDNFLYADMPHFGFLF